MRLRACWILLIATIAFAGCSSPSKRPGRRSASNDAPVPPIPAEPTPVGNSNVVKGLLAGQVKDKFNREVSKASIQLVELRDAGPAGAPIEIWSDEHGYFQIPGLETGGTYQLTARVAEGSKIVMAATQVARAPDPRMLIVVSEDNVTPVTPKPPLPPTGPFPEKPKTADEKKAPPAASIEKPVVPKTNLPPVPTVPEADRSSSEEPAPVRERRPDLKIEVPRRTPTLTIPSPPPPRRDPPAGESPYSAGPLPVPSCVMLTARQIDNFALADPEGNPFEFRRDRKGRLVLLDFWHTH